MVQVATLHLLNFTLKAKHLVQLATITRLQHLSLDNVTLEARNSIQKLTSLQVKLPNLARCPGLTLLRSTCALCHTHAGEKGVLPKKPKRPPAPTCLWDMHQV